VTIEAVADPVGPALSRPMGKCNGRCKNIRFDFVSNIAKENSVAWVYGNRLLNSVGKISFQLITVCRIYLASVR
jgi:hypothetical protein